jgi:hypothetical protein
MPETREAHSIIEKAEQAAAAGDYAAAEILLREAATLQEQTLGPQHPDLANTLNNLGVVCEMTDNPIDAEHYFRRALTIATAILPADHPFVATSRKNLHDFCAARGRPAELPPSPPAVAAWLDAPAAAAPAAPARQSLPPAERQTATQVPRPRSVRRLAAAGLSGIALLIVILTLTRPWGKPLETKSPPPAAAISPTRDAPAASPAPPAKTLARPHETANTTESGGGEANAAGARPDTPASPVVMPTVAAAQLCAALRDWRCESAGREVPPGPLFFYTQIKSSTAIRIEHRWYQGDDTRLVVPLRIEANPGAGYRTYSRNTIGGDRAGDWRVELRTADGTVLHEERFVVR